MLYLGWPSPPSRNGSMKGSDKWGQGGSLRIRAEWVVAALVVFTVVGVYVYTQGSQLTKQGQGGGISTVSTTGVQCGDSIPAFAQQIEQSANFSALGGTFCYNYNGESPSAAVTGTDAYLFDYYNGTIAYPCGDAPQELVTSQIVAVANSSTGKVLYLQLTDQTNLNAAPPCGAGDPLSVVSVTDVESTIPAVPQLNLTLAVNPGSRPITALTATLTLDGGSQTFLFGAAPSSKLGPGQTASSIEIVLGTVSFGPDEVYLLSISGTFDDGQAFTFQAHVQIAQIP